MSDSLPPHGLQDARPPCPSPTPGVYSKLMSTELVMPSNHLIPCHPLLLPPSIFSYQVAKVLELQLQHQSFQQIFRTDFLLGWTGWISLHPRDSQESSPTPHFKSIHSSVLSFLYSPTLTSIHDYWKLPPKNI